MKTIMWFGFVLGALSATDKVIVTKPGQKTTIKCGVTSFTNNVVWRHGDNMIVENKKKGFPRKGQGDIVQRSKFRQDTDLEIMGVKIEDAGQFTCVADWTSHEHTLLVVSVSASPSGDLLLGSDATLQCQVKGLDHSSTVQWKRPDGSAHGRSHTAELKPVGRSHAGTWNCIFSFGGKAYSESLPISVKEPAPTTSAPVTLKGSKHIHNPTCPNCVTTTPPSAAQLLRLSGLLCVAVGFVVLLVCVILLCKRISRRKSNVMDRAVNWIRAAPNDYSFHPSWIFSHLDDLESMDVSEAAESEGSRHPPPGPCVRDRSGSGLSSMNRRCVLQRNLPKTWDTSSSTKEHYT